MISNIIKKSSLNFVGKGSIRAATTNSVKVNIYFQIILTNIKLQFYLYI
jgi:hypothetical protein